MKKIKWGVMGTAFICERSTFPGMLQAENCEMYAIAGRSMEKADQFKEKYGFEKAYGSYEELLTDPEIVQMNVAASRVLGRYHMMTGQNPVYIITERKQ